MLTNYLRVALRNLLRQKEYSAINVLGLSVGMACCILIILLIRYEFSYDLHQSKADRIYKVLWRKRGVDGEFYNSRFTLGPLAERLMADYPEIEQGVRSFNRRMWVSHGNNGFTQSVCLVDAQYTDIFDVPLVRGDGRGLLTPNSIFITEKLSRTLFGDADPLGQVISIDYKWLQGDFTITGVMEDYRETTTYGLRFDALTASVPESDFKSFAWEDWNPHSTLHPFRTYLLLADGTSWEALEQKLGGFVKRHMGDAQEDSYHLQAITRVHLYSAVEFDAPHATYGDIRTIYAFALVGLFILLIACVQFHESGDRTLRRSSARSGAAKSRGCAPCSVVRSAYGRSDARLLRGAWSCPQHREDRTALLERVPGKNDGPGFWQRRRTARSIDRNRCVRWVGGR